MEVDAPEATAPQPAADSAVPTSTSGADVGGEMVQFKMVFGKNSMDVTRPVNSTVGQLKLEVEKTVGIPPAMQKLMLKGMLKDDSATLGAAGVKNGVKIMIIGSVPSTIPGAAAPASSDAAGDDEQSKPEPLSKQQPHAKILAKGKPEDAMPGIRDKQVPLADEVNHINGLLNSQGTKVRLTFKPELQQLWIGSATATQKVPYSSITKIESQPIEGQEEYSILALQLGTTTASKYWLYYFPTQYVAAIKIRILGVASLL